MSVEPWDPRGSAAALLSQDLLVAAIGWKRALSLEVRDARRVRVTSCSATTPFFDLGTVYIITTAVISIALDLTGKGEHTANYKINKNVYIKTSKTIII